MHRARDANPSGFCEALKAGCDVHAVAVEVAFLTDHVAQIDADPEPDAVVIRYIPLTLGHAALNASGAFDCIDSARELTEHPVPGQLDEPAVVFGEQRLDQLLAMRIEPRKRAGFITLHQARVARNVRNENSGEATLWPRGRFVHLSALPHSVRRRCGDLVCTRGLLHDPIGTRRPDERPGVSVMLDEIPVDGCLKMNQGAEITALQPPPR